jgi:anaerobic selenocysteine-containing dehydrogenase
MLDRRDFLKICSGGMVVLMISPESLLSSSYPQNEITRPSSQPRRRLYGNSTRGCAGWHGHLRELDCVQ